MGFEPGTCGLKDQVPSKTDYKIECQAKLTLLDQETLQAIDNDTNTVAKNQNVHKGSNH